MATRVWRVEDEEGHGPYHRAGETGCRAWPRVA